MMDTNERQEQQRYETLCAYVLGELPAEESARIEKELEGSAELRVQKAEIEATIGLVRGSLTAGDELSEAAAASVLARVGTGVATGAATKPRFRFLRGGRHLTKIAAGLAFLTLGFAGWRALKPTEPGAPFTYGGSLDGTTVARAERQQVIVDSLTEKDSLAESEESIALNSLQALGYTGGDGGSAGVHYRSAKEVDEETRLGRLHERAKTEPAPAEPSLEDAARYARKTENAKAVLAVRLRSLGYVADTPVGGPAASGTYKGPGDSAYPLNPDVVLSSSGVPSPLPGHGVFVGNTSNEANDSRGLALSAGHLVADENTGSSRTDSDNYLVGRGSAPAPPAEQALRAMGYTSGPAGPSASGSSLPASDKKSKLRSAGQEITGRDLAVFEVGAGSDDYFVGRGFKRSMDPEARRRYIEHECERIIQSCRRKPREHPRDMYFRYWGDNPFEFAQLDPLSTFSVDVDTASYTLARNYLNKGMIPPKAQVRTEEFVNYFKPDVPAPLEGTFRVHTELAPSRFGGGDANKWMLSVVVRGREVAETERKPLRLTFVVDTSGSMKQENRMELVKHALRLLLTKLDANDSIAIVAFSREARLILPMTSASQQGLIESAIYPLSPDGGTNAEAGLKMGYEVALAGHHTLATNRVVLLSDGVANIGQVDQDRINTDVTRHRSKGIYLNTVGVGMGNHNDVFLEQLANKGDGLCNYFDTPEEARRALVENFTGQFEPIARDVKLQVEFDPAQVARYRLLGYENRAIADADFRNDAVDAGEVNAGHQVVALYELERMPAAVADGPLATVRLRWKLPYGDAGVANDTSVNEAIEVEQPVLASQATGFEGASFGYRRAVVVAQFAELLRRSRHARDDSLDDLIAEAQTLRKQAPGDVELTEFVSLLQQSRTVILNSIPTCDELCRTIDEIRLRNLQVAQIQLLQRDNVLVDELQKQNVQLELTIRELLQQRLEQQGR